MSRKSSRWHAAAAAALAAAFTAIVVSQADGGGSPKAEVEVFFSPDGGALKAVDAEIRKAQKSIDAALYMITAPQLANSLASAHKRGVKVRVLLDKRQSARWSQASILEESEVPVSYVHIRKEAKDPSDPQFHHKFAVFDGQTVVTGSFNWTVMADERNHENILVIRDRDIAAAYTEAFEKGAKIAIVGAPKKD